MLRLQINLEWREDNEYLGKPEYFFYNFTIILIEYMRRNIMNKFDYVQNKILKVAEKEMLSCKHPYVGTEHLLLSLLKNKNISDLCNKFSLSYKDYKRELLNVIGVSSSESKYILYTPLLKLVINKARENAKKDNKDMDEYYLLASLLSYKDGIGYSIASGMGIDLDALTDEINKSAILCEYGKYLNDFSFDRIYLRDKEINELMQVLLRKNKNNPLLIGHAGVGKTAIVNELALRIKEGKVPNELKNKKIVSVSTSTLIAGTRYRGDFEARINDLIKECINNKDIILFIDEIHTIMKTGSSDGALDAGNILKPYLTNGDIKIIGATTISEFNEYIKKDQALLRRFTPVMVNEPNLRDMEYILGKVKKSYETYYKLKIGKNVVSYLLDKTDKYIPNLYNPDKSIEILDSVCSKKVLNNFINKSNDLEINSEDIDNLINERVNILNVDSEKINNLKSELEKKYNDVVVKNIINLIKDNKFNKYMYLNGLNKSKKNIIRYISDKLGVNLIEINCLEYNDEFNLSKLINNNYLYNKIEENPYSFIVFNNYDKASRTIYNLINSMISNGYISNMNNERVYLNNSVMFICSDEEVNNLGFRKVALG